VLAVVTEILTRTTSIWSPEHADYVEARNARSLALRRLGSAVLGCSRAGCRR
jgi:hypothetical protein